MKIKSYLSVLIITTAGNCFSQKVADTAYIGKYDQKMSAMVFLSRNSVEIEQNDKTYKPNNPLKVGIGFSLRNTVLNLSYGWAIPEVSNKEYGRTKSMDFQLHHYGRSFVLDLFFQKYKGFYNEEPTVELYSNTSVQAIGAEGTYLFKGDKFSAKAAFQQSEKQLKSAGSFVIGSGIYFYKIRDIQEMFPWDSNQINNFQFGGSAGYAYSWVINEHWLLSGIGTAGINLGNETKLLEEGKVNAYPTFFGRGSAGYHKNDWAVTFSFLIHNKSMHFTEDNSLNVNSLNMQITFVKHFDNPFKKKKQ